jgi:hypothetical protein
MGLCSQRALHQLRNGHVLGSNWSLDGLKLHFVLGWVDFLLRFIQQLHAVRSRQVFAFFGGECVHRVLSRHSLGSDWSLKLHFMLCWVVFLLRFIEQLHAVRRGQVLAFFGGECVHRSHKQSRGRGERRRDEGDTEKRALACARNPMGEEVATVSEDDVKSIWPRTLSPNQITLQTLARLRARRYRA